MKKVFTKKIFICLFAGLLFGETVLAAPFAGIYYYGNSSAEPVKQIKRHLSDMGYQSKSFQNYGAYHVRKDMDKDVIFYYNGDGKAGLLKCNGKTQLSAKRVANKKIYSLQEAFLNTGKKLKKVRLIYFSASNTANTSSKYGNLLTYTVSKLKAGVAVGFSKKISRKVSNYFDERFFYRLSQDLPVGEAVDKALEDTKKNFSKSVYNQSNISSVCYVGDSSMKIKIQSNNE